MVASGRSDPPDRSIRTFDAERVGVEFNRRSVNPVLYLLLIVCTENPLKTNAFHALGCKCYSEQPFFKLLEDSF